jgi:hypothetical protein
MATHQENMCNITMTKTSNLPRGVKLVHGKYFMSRIRVKGKDIYLGYYPTADEAGEVYRNAAEKYQGEFAYHHRAAA